MHFVIFVSVIFRAWMKITRCNKPFYSCVLSALALIGNEAGADLVLIQTSPLVICKCKLVSIRTA